jgi:hypothetical protein
MKLDTGVSVCCILDNTQQAFVGSLLDDDGLIDCLITAKHLDGLLGLVLCTILVDFKCWVHRIQIRTRGSGANSTALGCNGVDHAGLGDKDTRILLAIVGVQEDIGAVDVNDLALSLLASKLLDHVLEPDLGSVSVSSHRLLSLR